MNAAQMPGIGDPETWGPVISPHDPRQPEPCDDGDITSEPQRGKRCEGPPVLARSHRGARGVCRRGDGMTAIYNAAMSAAVIVLVLAGELIGMDVGDE